MTYLTYLLALLVGPSTATSLLVGNAIAGAHRPEVLGDQAVPVAQLLTDPYRPIPYRLPAEDEPIPFVLADEGEAVA